MRYYEVKYNYDENNIIYIKSDHHISLVQNIIVPNRIKNCMMKSNVIGITYRPIVLVNHDKKEILRDEWLITSDITVSEINIFCMEYDIVNIEISEILAVSEKIKRIFEQNNYRMYKFERIY